MSPITAGVKIPPRSRSFTEADAQEAHRLLTEYAAAGNVSEGVGYGSYGSPEAARAAGQSLNKMIVQLGLRDRKWATSVIRNTETNIVTDEDGNESEEVSEVFTGILLAKDAKVAPPAKKNGGRKRSGR